MRKPVDPYVIKFMEMRTKKDVVGFPERRWLTASIEAERYAKECPIGDLPKYINNPSPGIKETIKRRLGVK